jgi:REP element-mobilizing transposase RayT
MEAKTLKRWRNRLPHWEIENGTYFITVRCVGSLPSFVQKRIAELQASLTEIDPQDTDFITLQRKIFLAAEKYLDRGQGFAPFKNAQCCETLVEHLENLEQGWRISDWVIMPNHIHFLAANDGSGTPLNKMMQRFKGRSAVRINRMLGRQGAFWQRDWFDRWMRSESERMKTRQYISENPVKAKLARKPEAYPWWHSRHP